MPKTAKLLPLQQEFIEMATHIGQSIGQEHSMTVIFSILFSEPDAISMEDLAAKSGYSLALISQKIKILESFNIIQRTTRPGSKKVYLYMHKDLLDVWINQIYGPASKKISLAKELSPKLLDKYKNNLQSDRDKKVFNIIQDYYKQTKIIDQMLAEAKKIIEKYKYEKK